MSDGQTKISYLLLTIVENNQDLIRWKRNKIKHKMNLKNLFMSDEMYYYAADKERVQNTVDREFYYHLREIGKLNSFHEFNDEYIELKPAYQFLQCLTNYCQFNFPNFDSQIIKKLFRGSKKIPIDPNIDKYWRDERDFWLIEEKNLEEFFNTIQVDYVKLTGFIPKEYYPKGTDYRLRLTDEEWETKFVNMIRLFLEYLIKHFSRDKIILCIPED